MIKYSIITVCKNAEKEISKTIESILNQNIDFSLVEMVVVDGASDDDTGIVVNSYCEKAREKGLIINFKSEKDAGIYDAMNKGASLANGEWCLYLNAGDVFYNSDSLKNLINNEKEQYDIIYGDTIHVYKNRMLLVKAKSENELTYKRGMEFCHQSCIIKRVYLIENPYTQKYKIAGDYEFFTRAFKNGAVFHYVPEVISIFNRDGVSSTNGAMVYKENSEVQFQYNLINQAEYESVQKKMDRKLKMRKITPVVIVKMRHKILMLKTTRKWLKIK